MPLPTSPVARFSVLLLSALLVLVVGACDGNSGYRSPVAAEVPDAPVPPPPPPPPPPAANLTGSWAGTVTITWDEMDGGGSCAGTVTAVFVQSGAAVSGTLTDSLGCIASRENRFEGTLEGTSLRGDIVFPDYSWPTFGEVAGDRLTFSAFNNRWDLHR